MLRPAADARLCAHEECRSLARTPSQSPSHSTPTSSPRVSITSTLPTSEKRSSRRRQLRGARATVSVSVVRATVALVSGESGTSSSQSTAITKNTLLVVQSTSDKDSSARDDDCASSVSDSLSSTNVTVGGGTTAGGRQRSTMSLGHIDHLGRYVKDYEAPPTAPTRANAPSVTPKARLTERLSSLVTRSTQVTYDFINDRKLTLARRQLPIVRRNGRADRRTCTERMSNWCECD